MNYGGDAADQIVRYSLDGVDHGLRLSGTLAKHLAVMDTTATSLSMDNHIPVQVFALKDRRIKRPEENEGQNPDGADVKGEQAIEVLYRAVRPPERILQ